MSAQISGIGPRKRNYVTSDDQPEWLLPAFVVNSAILCVAAFAILKISSNLVHHVTVVGNHCRKPLRPFAPGLRPITQGKRFVWPPPRPDSDSGRSTPSMRHHTGHSIGSSWHPSESPAMSRTPPFASSPVPARRCKDDIWPPPSYRKQQQQELVQRAVSPAPHKQLHEFDEFVTQHASLAVPPTYHAPPETQHYTYEVYQ